MERKWKRKKINGVFMYWWDECGEPGWITKNYRDRIERELEEESGVFEYRYLYLDSEGNFVPLPVPFLSPYH